METLLFFLLGISFVGLITAVYMLFKLLGSKKNHT
jgi:hypothetical protein